MSLGLINPDIIESREVSALTAQKIFSITLIEFRYLTQKFQCEGKVKTQLNTLSYPIRNGRGNYLFELTD
jgi:hypothetical protein